MHVVGRRDDHRVELFGLSSSRRQSVNRSACGNFSAARPRCSGAFVDVAQGHDVDMRAGRDRRQVGPSLAARADARDPQPAVRPGGANLQRSGSDKPAPAAAIVLTNVRREVRRDMGRISGGRGLLMEKDAEAVLTRKSCRARRDVFAGFAAS